MEYRAVGNRCAVILDSLHLPISREEALAILNHKGFAVVEVDIIALARQCIGVSQYCCDARFSEAPALVDCSSFVKWVYAQRGIWLPRRSIQQREFGERIEFNEIIAGDLIFTSGFTDLYDDDPDDSVGHAGIATGNKTLICATKSKLGRGVVEVSQDVLLSQRKFRGARRYLPKDTDVLTLKTPVIREVEIADDIRWIVLQSL